MSSSKEILINVEKEPKNKSNVGMGIVYGVVLGVIIGLIFFPDNFAIGPGIGMSLGIVAGAILDANQNKKSHDEENQLIYQHLVIYSPPHGL